MSCHSEALREGLDPEFVADWRDAESLDAVRLLAADVLDAIPGDDKLAVIEWAVKIAAAQLASSDITNTTLVRFKATDDMLRLSRSCPPSVRAALRGES